MVPRDSLYSEVVVVPRSRGVARKCEELVERAVARSLAFLVLCIFRPRTSEFSPSGRQTGLHRPGASPRYLRDHAGPWPSRAWHRIVHAPEGRGTPKSPPKPLTSHLHTSRLTTLATTSCDHSDDGLDGDHIGDHRRHSLTHLHRLHWHGWPPSRRPRPRKRKSLACQTFGASSPTSRRGSPRAHRRCNRAQRGRVAGAAGRQARQESLRGERQRETRTRSAARQRGEAGRRGWRGSCSKGAARLE